MKRILAIVFLMAFALVNVSKAQTPIKLKSTDWQYVYNGVRTIDTLGSAKTTWSMMVNPNKIDAVYSNQLISLSRLSTTDTVNITWAFQGKYFVSDTTYTTLGTGTYTGTKTDTLLQCPLFTSKNGYNYYRQILTRNKGSVKINYNKWIFRK